LATAEAVGILAVVVSLIYLATQVRFARLTTADPTRHIRADSVRYAVLMVGNNLEFAKLWLKATRTELTYELFGGKLDFAELDQIHVEYYTIPSVSDSWQRSPCGKNFLYKFFVDRSLGKK